DRHGQRHARGLRLDGAARLGGRAHHGERRLPRDDLHALRPRGQHHRPLSGLLLRVAGATAGGAPRRRVPVLRCGSAATSALAPLLDFVMTRLLFFISASVSTREFGPAMSRHSAPTGAPAKEAASLLIAITATGEILIDERQVDIRAVRANVERMHALKPENG